jgi:hypothetical protein
MPSPQLHSLTTPDALVSYYYQYLWCYDRMDNSSFDVLCSTHTKANVTALFDPIDLQNYQSDHTYFVRNPHRLFALEQPFRILARAWANRIREDDEAITRIISRAIDARVLEVEYLYLFGVMCMRYFVRKMTDQGTSNWYCILSNGK